MIRAIAVMDSKKGLANDKGIPWLGKIPTDTRYFREKTENSTILMGFNTYKEFAKPLSNRRNLVLTNDPTPLRPGWEPVNDIALSSFLNMKTSLS
jgi:dihydrofolate reductase